MTQEKGTEVGDKGGVKRWDGGDKEKGGQLTNWKTFLLLPPAEGVYRIKGVSSWLRVRIKSMSLPASTFLARSRLSWSSISSSRALNQLLGHQ